MESVFISGFLSHVKVSAAYRQLPMRSVIHLRKVPPFITSLKPCWGLFYSLAEPLRIRTTRHFLEGNLSGVFLDDVQRFIPTSRHHAFSRLPNSYNSVFLTLFTQTGRLGGRGERHIQSCVVGAGGPTLLRDPESEVIVI